MSPQGMPGETGGVYLLCRLFKAHPELHYRSLTIRENGHIEIACDGANVVVRDWARALPNHRVSDGFAATSYGGTQAVVLTEEQITVTVRPPIVPGGVG